MYYSNSDAAPKSNGTATFEIFNLTDIISLWHLNESSGTLYDSTPNNHDGTNHGAEYMQNAKVDGGYDLTPNDYISINDDTGRLQVFYGMPFTGNYRRDGSLNAASLLRQLFPCLT